MARAAAPRMKIARRRLLTTPPGRKGFEMQSSTAYGRFKARRLRRLHDLRLEMAALYERIHDEPDLRERFASVVAEHNRLELALSRPAPRVQRRQAPCRPMVRATRPRAVFRPRAARQHRARPQTRSSAASGDSDGPAPAALLELLAGQLAALRSGVVS